LSFWDSSAVVPLLISEDASHQLVGLITVERMITIWWGTPVECASAIIRRERETSITTAEARAALRRLEGLQGAWAEITPSARIREIALRLLRVHPLRSADSLQLAAAIIAADENPGTLPFLSLDQRLRLAAEREGFPVGP
jgi:hypothetical protein